MKRLGVIARLAIVASFVWMIGGTIVIGEHIKSEARGKADAFYHDCIMHHGGKLECMDSSQGVYRAHTEELQGGVLGMAAFEAGAILIVAALSIGMVYSIGKWVLAGRRKD